MTTIRADRAATSTPERKVLNVWAGPDADHLDHCGTVTMLPAEAAELIARLAAGEQAAERAGTFQYELMDAEWAKRTRELAAGFLDGAPEDVRQAATMLSAFLGEELRSEFPDLHPSIVGWVATRTSTHLAYLAARFPTVPAANVAVIGLLAGQHISGSGS